MAIETTIQAITSHRLVNINTRTEALVKGNIHIIAVIVSYVANIP